jgi:heavy metal efflux system protein
MLKHIVSFCLSRRAVVVFGLLLFAGAGVAAFRNLDIEAYPNPSPVVLEITAQAPGQSSLEMERYYTIPIEKGLYTVPGINVIRSTSFYGLSFVRVVFNYGVPYDFAYAQTVIALQQNVSLPNSVTANVQQNSGTGEILRYQVVGPRHFGLTNLRTVQDWIVRRRLLQVHGIVAVNSWGGPTKEFEVNFDPRKLREYGLAIPQIIAALGNSNVNVGAREIAVGQQSVNIRGIGLIDDGGEENLTDGYEVGDIDSVVLGEQNGIPILLKDVASVKVGYRPRLGIAGRDRDDDIVFGICVMGRTYQTSRVLPQLEAAIDKLNHDGSLPPGVRVVPFYARSELIALTTHTVMHNLIFGSLLVFLIQWIFLGDLRSALIVGLTIPFALIFAVIILVARGESANLLSLGAVDFGIIVDSAVIVMENIFRNLQRPPAQRQSLLERLAAGAWGSDPTLASDRARPVRGWTDRMRLILVSVMQVDRAVLFSVLIIVAAFVPLFTMEGVEGAIFGPMARTYAYALAGALIATFSVTPVLTSLLLPEQLEESETVLVRWLHRGYEAALRFSLSHRVLVVAAGVAFLAVGAYCWTRLGSEFLPHLDEGNLWIRAELPMTLTLDGGTAATREMRLILMRFPEVLTVVSQHGRPDDGSDASPFSNIELDVPLKPRDEWPAGVTKEALVDQIQAQFQAALPGVSFNFSQYIQDNIEEAMSGVKGENSVKIVGPNLETLTDLAGQVRSQLAKVRGIADLGVFPVLGQPDLDIRIDRAAAARYGLNTGDVNTVIQAALGGTVATEVLEGDRQFDLVVRYARRYRDDVEKIRGLEVAYTAGNGAVGYVPLEDIAQIRLVTGAAWVYHEGGERFIPVKFSVRGRDLAGAVREGEARIGAHVRLPPGYRIEWSGEYGELEAAQRRLEVIIPVSLVLILGLLYSLFNSLRECLLSLTGIPFTVAGGVLGLYFTGRNFSISAAIGFISLFGVSVMIGILLTNHYNRARLRGLAPGDAMFEAASHLMRPLLMMSLAAGIGLLPAAVSRGIGSEVQRPLATVVVSGMFFGSIMLLLVVPTLKMLLLGRGDPARRSRDA